MKMPKANIETKSGTKITIEGNSEEISDIVSVIQRRESGQPTRSPTKTTTSKNKVTSLTDLIIEMREEGYFDKPQGLIEVKKILEEKGHIYPVTTLSGTLLTQARKRILRRIREGKRWVYVKGSV